jgi:hypothetical protein
MTSIWSYTDDKNILALETPIERDSLLMALKYARDNGVAITFAYGEIKNTGFLCIRGCKSCHYVQRAIAGSGVEVVEIVAAGVINVVNRLLAHPAMIVNDKKKTGAKIFPRKTKGNPPK